MPPTEPPWRRPAWRRQRRLWWGAAALAVALIIGCSGLAVGFAAGRLTDGPGHGRGWDRAGHGDFDRNPRGGWDRGDRRGWPDGTRRDRRSEPGQNSPSTAPTAPASSLPAPAAS